MMISFYTAQRFSPPLHHLDSIHEKEIKIVYASSFFSSISGSQAGMEEENKAELHATFARGDEKVEQRECLIKEESCSVCFFHVDSFAR
jgi:hypothetical protein